MRRAAALLLLLLLAAGGASRADELQLGPDHWLRQRIQTTIRPGVTLRQVEELMRIHFYNSDFDGTGVSAKSHDTFLRLRRARDRSGIINALLALALDGDGVITGGEIETVARHNALRAMTNMPSAYRRGPEGRKRLATAVATELANRLRHDTNHDGRLTLAEVVAAAESELAALEAARAKSDRLTPEQRRAAQVAELVPLALDADGDGVVSLAEYDAAVAAVFREYDDDGDGTISAAEAAAHKNHAATLKKSALEVIETRRKELLLSERIAGCGLPELPAGVTLVLFGTARGTGISNVDLGGSDGLIEVADIIVEPGTAPLVLVLTSAAPMIWDIGGATERLVRVIVAADDKAQPRAPARGGVVGLAREKVTIAGRSDCVPAFHRPDDHDAAGAALASILGRPADIILGAHQTGLLRLPSGVSESQARLRGGVTAPRREPAAEVFETMRRDYPAGLIAFEPGEIVSAAAAARYAVAPFDAGLAQLVDEGALAITRYSHGVILQPGGPKPYREAAEFLVKRTIRLPAGLTKRRLVFVLAAGVSMPEGDLGNSCVLAADRKPLVDPANCPKT